MANALPCADKANVEKSTIISQQTLMSVRALYGNSVKMDKMSSKLRSIIDRNKNEMAATARYRLICEASALELFMMSYYYRCQAASFQFNELSRRDMEQHEQFSIKLHAANEFFGDEPPAWKTLDWDTYRSKLIDLRSMVEEMKRIAEAA